MKTIVWLSVIIVTIIVQSTVLPLIGVQGIYPDILLVVVVSYALLSGKEKGVGMGFFAGLLQDLAFGSVFGTNTLSKLAVGYFFGLAERKVFKEHVLLPVATTAVATIANSFFILVILSILGYNIDLISSLTNNVLPLAFYNLLIAIPVHHLIHRLTRFAAE